MDDVHVPELFSERCRNDACPGSNHPVEWLVPEAEKCSVMHLANTPRRDIAIVLAGFWTLRSSQPSESDRGAREGRTGNARPEARLGATSNCLFLLSPSRSISRTSVKKKSQAGR